MTVREPWTRRKFIQRASFLAGGFGAARLLAACGEAVGDTLDQARRRGFAKIGFADEPPYGYVDESGRPTGMAPELARAVLRRLDVPDVDGILAPFGSLIERLDERGFDLIAAGMFITPDRCGRVLFSEPDFCVEQAFLVPAGNPAGIIRYEDLARRGLRVGVLVGAVEGDQAADAGIPPGRIRPMDTPADLLESLRRESIDAVALTTVSVANLAASDDLAGFEATPPFTIADTPGCGAFGFRPADTRLRDEFNRILRDLRRSGEGRAVVEPFGFGSAYDAAAAHSASDLCAG